MRGIEALHHIEHVIAKRADNVLIIFGTRYCPNDWNYLHILYPTRVI